ncbi:hypothetical protein HDK64DRAFT_101378 [Phyllosticta capitalensis]
MEKCLLLFFFLQGVQMHVDFNLPSLFSFFTSPGVLGVTGHVVLSKLSNRTRNEGGQRRRRRPIGMASEEEKRGTTLVGWLGSLDEQRTADEGGFSEGRHGKPDDDDGMDYHHDSLFSFLFDTGNGLLHPSDGVCVWAAGQN